MLHSTGGGGTMVSKRDLYNPYIRRRNGGVVGFTQYDSPYIISDVSPVDTPGVFEVTMTVDKKSDKETYSLEQVDDRFTVPERIFGNLNYYIEYYWRAFKRHNFKSGVLLTGQKGAGKSETAKVLCNRLIDSGLRAVMLTNVSYSAELIKFLDGLDNVVFFFDEFSKIFPQWVQGKMLTLLNNGLGKTRTVIITENEKMSISNYIRNRPGRIRYSKHFDKLHISTVNEYIEYMRVTDKEFIEAFLKLYKKMTGFAFDHLQSIVTEHLDEPDVKFKELIDILNLDEFTPDKVFKLKEIKYIGKDKELLKDKEIVVDECFFNPSRYDINMLDKNMDITLVVKTKSTIPEQQNERADALVNVTINKKFIHILMDSEVEFRTDTFSIIFDIAEEDVVKDTKTNITTNIGNRPGTGFKFN